LPRKNESIHLGFGIFYWSSTVAFIFPLLLVPYMKRYLELIVIMAAVEPLAVSELFVYKNGRRLLRESERYAQECGHGA
jgi:hypothetical protein